MSNWLVNKLGQLEREAGAVMVSQSQNDQVLVAELRTWYSAERAEKAIPVKAEGCCDCGLTAVVFQGKVCHCIQGIPPTAW